MTKVFVYGALMKGAPGLSTPVSGYVADHAVHFLAKGVRWLEPSFAALVPKLGSRASGVCFNAAPQAPTLRCPASALTPSLGFPATVVVVLLGLLLALCSLLWLTYTALGIWF